MTLQRDLVFDVGMHLGEDSDFYLRKGFRVVGIEASPSLSAAAAERLSAALQSGRLTVLNVAVCEEDGPVRFYENQANSVWGTLHASWAERNARLGAPSSEITVPGRRFEGVLAQFGIPYYLKIDIEGSDLLCLEALRAFDDRPRYLSFESTKTSWRDLEHEFELLAELGYRRFKVVHQGKVVQQAAPNPAREGRYVDHRFSFGSSGLFGEEAPGRWLSHGEALDAYRGIFRSYRLFGDDGWFTRLRLARKVAHRIGLGLDWYDTHAGM